MNKRVLLDMTMLLTFAVLLDYRYIHNLGHEILALLFMILFFFHVKWNWSWYKNLTKGHWNGIRRRLTLLNLLLLLTTLILMVTGLCISHHLSFFGFHFPLWIHRLHRIAGFSMLILVGLHLGFNWNAMWGRMKQKLSFLAGPIHYPLLLLIAGSGIYFSFYYHIGGRLLLIPLSQLGRPPVTLGLFILAHLSIISLYAILGYYFEKIMRHV